MFARRQAVVHCLPATRREKQESIELDDGMLTIVQLNNGKLERSRLHQEATYSRYPLHRLLCRQHQ